MQRSYNNHTFKVSLKNPQSELLKMEHKEGKGERGQGERGQGWGQRPKLTRESPGRQLLEASARVGEQFLSGFHAGSIPHSCSETSLDPFSLHPTALGSNFCPSLAFSGPVCEHRLLCSSFNPQNTPKICVTMTEPRGPKARSPDTVFAA